MPSPRLAVLVPAALGALILGGCSSSGSGAGGAVAPVRATSAATTPTPAPVASNQHRHRRREAHPQVRQHAAPPFRWSVARVTAAELGRSWRPGCPVGPGSLRALSLTYRGFDGRSHTGTLVVASTAVAPVAAAFHRLYTARFPIRRMVPVAAYGGSDDRSMAYDNTSAFNCRYAVANGPRHWSEHAYGAAVDLDPLENPYRLDGRVLPRGGGRFLDRGDVRPGMVVAGSAAVTAFGTVGWGWGGGWSGTPDYQHFSATGN